MQKIAILLEPYENIADEGISKLQNTELELVWLNNDNQLYNNQSIKDVSAILVRGAAVNEKIMTAMPKLKIIARAGVGTDNIEIETATERNIYVCNVPDANFISVAEHVLSMILALSHQVIPGNKKIREGAFEARHHYIGTELMGKTIGIFGFGRIGKMVAQICVYGFNMNVLAYDPFVKSTDIIKVRLVNNPDTIYDEADYITLHLPYTEEHHHYISEQELTKMKKSAYIINCARGGLIDEVALTNAIQRGEIAGAGVDVFEQEPPSINHVLWDSKEIIATPHMGASTSEALTRMAVGAAEEIIRVLNDDTPLNAINSYAVKNK